MVCSQHSHLFTGKWRKTEDALALVIDPGLVLAVPWLPPRLRCPGEKLGSWPARQHRLQGSPVSLRTALENKSNPA